MRYLINFFLLFVSIFLLFSVPVFASQQLETCRADGSALDREKIAEMIEVLTVQAMRPSEARNAYAIRRTLEAGLAQLNRRSIEALLIREQGPKYVEMRGDKLSIRSKGLLKEFCKDMTVLSNDPDRAVDELLWNIKFFQGKGWPPGYSFESMLAALIDLHASLNNQPRSDVALIPCVINPRSQFSLQRHIEEMTELMTALGDHLEQPQTEQTCCICYTDSSSWDVVQAGFQKGCNNWIQRQGECSLTEVRRHDELPRNKAIELPGKCDQGTLKLGFVGHWRWDLTDDIIEDIFVPTAQYHNVKIDYDNTACSALRFPEHVTTLLKGKKIPQDVSIRIKGSQCTSVGEWGPYLGPSLNFTCEVGSDCDEPVFPSCNPYLQQACSLFQESETARCHDATQQLVTLKCCGFKYHESHTRKSYFWLYDSDCP